MFNNARSSARTLLVAASTAGFVALGAGIAGADALGGATDGLRLDDLGSQVPAPLTEGLSTPLGDLAKVEPGQISAQPDVRRQSAPEPLGGIVGDSVNTPIETGEGNSTNLGPLDLVPSADTLAQGSASPVAGDPVSGLLSGLGLGDTNPLSGLGLGGSGLTGGQSTLPLSQPVNNTNGKTHSTLNRVNSAVKQGTHGLGGGKSTLPLGNANGESRSTLNQLGSAVERGTHEVGGELNGLDATVPASGDTLPLAAALDTPVAPINGQNADLTGGTAGIVSDLVLSDDVALPMSAERSPLPQPVGDAPIELLPVPEDALPVAGPETAAATELVVDTVRMTELDPGADTFGNDLVGVEGMPQLGEPSLDTGALDDTLSGGLV
ncbi:hypothetical protein [Nocardiopsis sp. FR6]|uniref:hypothetical protein n=1 Tax=Nocardiopsis sp. FR6 TaxID=2605986 RepID=UPI001357EF93|nr:hypothetical protein [Nocardiopsis sp. FR6]